MSTHKIDNLFKKKLSKHTIAPSSDAWAKMESALEQPAKKPVWLYYRIAAAVLLLFISVIVFYQFQKTEMEQLVEVPMENSNLEAQANILEKENKTVPQNADGNKKLNDKNSKETKNEVLKAPRIIKNLVAKQTITKEPIETQEDKVPIISQPIENNFIAMEDKVNIENKEFKVKNVVLPKQEEKKSRPKVKIIYKRGKSPAPQALLAKNDTTSKKKFNFNKIIDVTKHITSGDLIADMRDAKDDFFSRGLDLNKSDRVKNKNSNK